MHLPAVYLAGPEVFLPNAIEVGARKVALCARHGIEGLFPLDAVDTSFGEYTFAADEARALFDACVSQLDRCDAVIANITPFRGPSADVGTAWEMGYAAGLGKPVFAYTSDVRSYADRVLPDGNTVESFGLVDNLMLACSASLAGIHVERFDAAAAGADPIAALEGFESCVVRAAALLLGDRWADIGPGEPG